MRQMPRWKGIYVHGGLSGRKIQSVPLTPRSETEHVQQQFWRLGGIGLGVDVEGEGDDDVPVDLSIIDAVENPSFG